MRSLILGGTSQARHLCMAIAARPEIDAILSLAGRTQSPAAQAIATRIGGFGGIAGLVTYLRAEKIARVIDATHPFAARMSQNAITACAMTQIPLLVYTRPPWLPQPGDLWTSAADNQAAARALGAEPRRVFLTVGRLGLPDFASAPQHFYLVRTIDDPGALSYLPHHDVILARGPFSLDDEVHLLRTQAIEWLVSKNSGGTATEAKFAAARALRIPVIMIERPLHSAAQTTHDLETALDFLLARTHDARTERGV